AGGIGSPLNNAISSGKWSNVGAFLLTLILLVILIEYCSTKVRARLAHGRK
ncbi:MAG: phosphonate ABC transporter, permease protein PhnE, partial [Solobacterium sp.]|nr:phosphonate ABC transporter, permease protein PhnE [Solobacterium sp.]